MRLFVVRFILLSAVGLGVFNSSTGAASAVCKDLIAKAGSGEKSSAVLPRSAEFTASWFDQDHYILTPTGLMDGPTSSFSFAEHGFKKWPQFFGRFEMSINSKGQLILPTISRLNKIIDELRAANDPAAPHVKYYEDPSSGETPVSAYVRGLAVYAEPRLPVALKGHTALDGSLFLHDVVVHSVGYLTLTKEQANSIHATFRFLSALAESSSIKANHDVRAKVLELQAGATQLLDRGSGQVAATFIGNPESFKISQTALNGLNVNTFNLLLMQRLSSLEVSGDIRAEIKRIYNQFDTRALEADLSTSESLEKRREAIAGLLK